MCKIVGGDTQHDLAGAAEDVPYRSTPDYACSPTTEELRLLDFANGLDFEDYVGAFSDAANCASLPPRRFTSSMWSQSPDKVCSLYRCIVVACSVFATCSKQSTSDPA